VSGRLGGTQSRSGRFVEDRSSLFLPVIETRLPSFIPCILVIVSTALWSSIHVPTVLYGSIHVPTVLWSSIHVPTVLSGSIHVPTVL
jgi:hypothetical protein